MKTNIPARIIMIDYNHAKWRVYADIGDRFMRNHRSYKSLNPACKYAYELMQKYQVENLTEIYK